MQWDDYASLVSQFYQVQPKLKIIEVLKSQFDSLSKETNHKWNQVYISVQILALTVELIEDLAAMCYAYSEAKGNKNNRIPEYLREFGRKKRMNAEKFYRKTDSDIRYVADVVGLDAIKDFQQVIVYQQRLKKLGQFRNQYYGWYKGYKHGQRVIPVVVEGNRWGVYSILKKFIEQKGQILNDVSSFLETTIEVDKYIEHARLAVELYKDIKARQHPLVFP